MGPNQQPSPDGTDDRYHGYETDDGRFVVYDSDNGDAWVHSSAATDVER